MKSNKTMSPDDSLSGDKNDVTIKSNFVLFLMLFDKPIGII